MKKINIVLLVFIAAFGAMAFTFMFVNDLKEEASMYTDFESAFHINKKVHIAGEWVNRDDYSYDGDNDVLEFYLKDTLQHIEKVRYYDPMPSNFESAEKVVVVGSYEGNVFVADKILMKCPSKYNETEIHPGDQTGLVPADQMPANMGKND